MGVKYPSLIRDNFLKDPLSGFWFSRNLVLSDSAYGYQKNGIYKKGFQISSVFNFMSFFTTVVRNVEFSEDERKQLLESFTGEFLNDRFVKGKGFLDLDILNTTIAKGIKGLITLRFPLEPCLKTACFADLNSLNSQGYPTQESSVQEYKEGQNFFFRPPINGGIVVASRYNKFQLDGAGTSKCFRTMGIRPCVEGDLEVKIEEPEAKRVEEVKLSSSFNQQTLEIQSPKLVRAKKKLKTAPYRMHSDSKRIWVLPINAEKEVMRMLGNNPGNVSKYLFHKDRSDKDALTQTMHPQDRIISYWVMLHKCNYLYNEWKSVAEDLLTLAVARIMYREHDPNSEEIAAINQFEADIKRRESIFEDDNTGEVVPTYRGEVKNITLSCRKQYKLRRSIKQ